MRAVDKRMRTGTGGKKRRARLMPRQHGISVWTAVFLLGGTKKTAFLRMTRAAYKEDACAKAAFAPSRRRGIQSRVGMAANAGGI